MQVWLTDVNISDWITSHKTVLLILTAVNISNLQKLLFSTKFTIHISLTEMEMGNKMQKYPVPSFFIGSLVAMLWMDEMTFKYRLCLWIYWISNHRWPTSDGSAAWWLVTIKIQHATKCYAESWTCTNSLKEPKQWKSILRCEMAAVYWSSSFRTLAWKLAGL